MSDKRKFKDTKLGAFFAEKMPQGLSFLGDLLPDSGVLGIAKNMIDASTLSIEEKEQAQAIFMDELKLHNADRADARSREVELAKAGKMDWMMQVVGLVVLTVFVLCVVTVLFFDLKNENLAHLIIGEVIGITVGMVAYYYGTSKSSADKTKLLTKS
ncbi:MAG: hypothetical protein RIC03_06970 [Cyclobacteriaceae bacterium]